MKKTLLLLIALALPIRALPQSSQVINGSRTLPSGSSLRMQVANESGTGTTVNLLAKLTSTGAIKATITDTNLPVFIVEAGAGTTGNAEIAVIGHGNCIMDTTTSNTEGFYVVESTTTDGRCHAQSSAPTAYIVGTMVSNSTTTGSAAVVQVIGTFNIAGAGSGTVTSIATTSPIAGGTITTSGTINCPTCATSAAALTDLSPVLGSGGGQGMKTVAGITSDGVSGINLGVAGTSVGFVALRNATSGAVTLQAVTGALGSVTASLPANTGTIAELNFAQTWSALQTFGTNISIGGVTAGGATGTGNVVFATTPTLTTPVLGVATATSINKMAITAPATSSTLAVADGKTFTASNTMTMIGTDGSSYTMPGASATMSFTVASGTSALGTGAITSATCATVVTTSATGTATTDTVLAGFNGDPTAVTGYIPATAGMLTIIGYPTTNNVNFKVCNNTAGSVTPGAITLNWRVIR